MKTETGTDLNLVASGTIIEGKLRTPGSIRIEGRIVGEITAAQSIAVGSSGEVDGNMTAKNVTIGGKTKGTVLAQEKLVFESKAVVQGDIRTAKLVIDEGALFDGKCMMSETKPMPPRIEPQIKRSPEEQR